MFTNNIIRKATKDVTASYESKTGNSAIIDVRGYSKAVVKFSAVPNVRVLGYIDAATDTSVVWPHKTDWEGNYIEDNVTVQTVIIDVSNISKLYYAFDTAYTGSVTVHLSQDEAVVNKESTSTPTEDIKLTFSDKTGNSRIIDCANYSRAVIQFSANSFFTRIYGYIDKSMESSVISPSVTNRNKRVVSNGYITENTKTVVVDLSMLSCFYLNFTQETSYTGDIFIRLDKNAFEVDYSGVTNIATVYFDVVSGTNSYETGFIGSMSHYRFIAVEVRRRDGNGYLPFTAKFTEWHRVKKTQGSGPAYNNGRVIIDVADARGGYAESDWFENYSTESISIEMTINGTAYDGALFEINILGIA